MKKGAKTETPERVDPCALTEVPSVVDLARGALSWIVEAGTDVIALAGALDREKD